MGKGIKKLISIALGVCLIITLSVGFNDLAGPNQPIIDKHSGPNPPIIDKYSGPNQPIID